MLNSPRREKYFWKKKRKICLFLFSLSTMFDCEATRKLKIGPTQWRAAANGVDGYFLYNGSFISCLRQPVICSNRSLDEHSGHNSYRKTIVDTLTDKWTLWRDSETYFTDFSLLTSTRHTAEFIFNSCRRWNRHLFLLNLAKPLQVRHLRPDKSEASPLTYFLRRTDVPPLASILQRQCMYGDTALFFLSLLILPSPFI